METLGRMNPFINKPLDLSFKLSLNSNTSWIDLIEGDSTSTSQIWDNYAKKSYPKCFLDLMKDMILVILDLCTPSHSNHYLPSISKVTDLALQLSSI